MQPPPMRTTALTTIVTFALALGVFALVRSGGDAPAVAPAAAQGTLDEVPAANTPQRIARLQAAVRTDAGSPILDAGLASAYHQRVRETGDVSFYARADDALRRGLRAGPGEPSLLTTRGVLRLARHDFRG